MAEELGCPGESACPLFEATQYTACAPCSKKVRVPGVPLDGIEIDAFVATRIKHLTKLEAMEAAGCRFAMNDLAPIEWDELILLARERNYVQEEVRKQREKQADISRETNTQLQKARATQGLPPPGQSLFKR